MTGWVPKDGGIWQDQPHREPDWDTAGMIAAIYETAGTDRLDRLAATYRCAVCGQVHPGRRTSSCPDGPPDPVQAILAAINEPLGLPGASLPAYGVPGDGCCRECLRPPVHSQGLCVYCAALEPGQARWDLIWCRSVVCLGLLVWACIIALWAAGVIR